MTPQLQALMNAAAVVELSPADRLQIVQDQCRQLSGYIQTNGITGKAFVHGRKIADTARRMLPPYEAARFAPLATLKETTPGHWTFIDLAAHVDSYAKEEQSA